MDQQTSTPDTPTLADHLAQATQSLADALANLDGQFASLHAKIDRIIAAVDDGELQKSPQGNEALHNQVAELEKSNQNLKAQAATARRRTLSPMVTGLLAKQGVDSDTQVEASIVEKALAGLSIEQRIAVKAELARAGILA
jgi:hypothetical protein